MHGLALIYVLRDIPGVASFKIVQETTQLTTVFVEPESSSSQTTSGALRQA
jgi:phenylacetate-CoA ligase